MTPDDVVWRPDPQRAASSELARFQRYVSETAATDADVSSYEGLWRWSTEDLDGFWRCLAGFFDVPVAPTADGKVAPETMPGGHWFPGTRLNYAERALAAGRTGDAIVAMGEDGRTVTTSWAELRCQVAALSTFLRASGVRHGDRVAAVLPNTTEAAVGLLASASVGAVWSVVSPEFGPEAIVSRLQQLEPVVLIAVGEYRYGGKLHDRSPVMEHVIAGLPSLREIVWVGRPPSVPARQAAQHDWSEVATGDNELVVDPVPFEHPLWVLFSSGTTGVPKGIVHGHGSIVLEHAKMLALQSDLRAGQTLLIVGSTSWVVWTTLVSGLQLGARIVLLDGNPAYPDLDRVWQVAAEHQVAVLGLGAAYVHACLRAGLEPGRDHDLSALRMLQVTGSPLSHDGYAWVYRAVHNDVWLASMSGGTDVASIFVGGDPGAPVRSGRLQAPALGVAVAAWDADGVPVVGRRGELVVTRPMPSMPLWFWNDPDGSRYRNSYFSIWPGIWRHGDFIEFDVDGSSVIHGRSDSTLNRNGIRMGSADLYLAVEALSVVREALVIGVELGDDYYMPLFVEFAEGCDPEQACDEIRQAIRASLSPRYLPDDIVSVRAVPHTRTGKKLEVPVKRLYQGDPLDSVVDLGSVDDPDLMREYERLARRHRGLEPVVRAHARP